MQLADSQDANKALREDLKAVRVINIELTRVNIDLTKELETLKATRAKSLHEIETARANSAVLGAYDDKSVT